MHGGFGIGEGHQGVDSFRFARAVEELTVGSLGGAHFRLGRGHGFRPSTLGQLRQPGFSRVHVGLRPLNLFETCAIRDVFQACLRLEECRARLRRRGLGFGGVQHDQHVAFGHRRATLNRNILHPTDVGKGQFSHLRRFNVAGCAHCAPAVQFEIGQRSGGRCWRRRGIRTASGAKSVTKSKAKTTGHALSAPLPPILGETLPTPASPCFASWTEAPRPSPPGGEDSHGA